MADIQVLPAGTPIPRVKRGRKFGDGCNLRQLEAMDVGSILIPVPRNKMLSIHTTASRNGIKLSITKIPESDDYAITKVANAS